MLRAVLDTNVIVSSFLVKEGQPARVLDAWRGRAHALIISPPLIAEIRTTLAYPRIRRKYTLADEVVDGLITLLEHDAIIVPGEADVEGAVPEDPDDEMVLACALDAGADVIVSGDKHLFELGGYQNIPILTVRDFLERITADQGS